MLGVEPYVERPEPACGPGYVEYRMGDFRDELGLVHRNREPAEAGDVPGGAIMHGYVDDIEAAFGRLSLGAREYQPIINHGDSGFVSASVIDAFGTVQGIMYNPHYVEP